MSRSVVPAFLNLPEELFYNILTFISCNRPAVLCFQLQPLSKACYSSIENNGSLWQTLLTNDCHHVAEPSANRRLSKRLKKSPKDLVRDSYILLKQLTDVAHFHVVEHALSKHDSLNISKLRRVLKEFGPNLHISRATTSGGTFLVDCCRARYITENVILRCIKELVEMHGADVNVPTGAEANNSKGLTPLCVAAARGMPSVVRYLLSVGADASIRGTGKFRLYFHPSKTMSGTMNPQEFATVMTRAEIRAGASTAELRSLSSCINLLKRHTQLKEQKTERA